jgi:hypothetical protein
MLFAVVALLAFNDVRAGSSKIFASLAELVLLDCAYASIPVKEMTTAKDSVKPRNALDNLSLWFYKVLIQLDKNVVAIKFLPNTVGNK